MKRYLWLFVLPYVVAYSSSNERERSEIKAIDSNSNYGFIAYECPHDLKCGEFIKDLTQALNDAHEKRKSAGKGGRGE